MRRRFKFKLILSPIQRAKPKTSARKTGRRLGGKPAKGLFIIYLKHFRVVLLVCLFNEHKEKARAPRTKIGT